VVLVDLWLNYDDFTMSTQTNANTKDSCGIANEYVVRLEGKVSIYYLVRKSFGQSYFPPAYKVGNFPK